MFKMFYLMVAVTLLYTQSVVSIEYNNTTDDIRERCATCIAQFSSQNVNLNEIEMYEGFEGFLIKYDAIQQYGVEDPEVICLLTNMCSFNDEEEEPQTDLIGNFVGQNYDHDLIVEEELNVFDLKTIIKKCNLCRSIFKWILQKIEHLTGKQRKLMAVRKLLFTSCKYVRPSSNSLCTALIQMKNYRLAKMALERYTPQLACKNVESC